MKYTRIVIVTLFLITTCIMLSTAVNAASNEMQVTVTDATTQHAISGAQVTMYDINGNIYGSGLFTNSAGQVSFTGMPANGATPQNRYWHIVTHASGYTDSTYTWDYEAYLENGQGFVYANVHLNPIVGNTVIITGQVGDSNNGNAPIPGAYVGVTSNGNNIGGTYVQSNGHYTITFSSGLNNGNYLLYCTAGGYHDSSMVFNYPNNFVSNIFTANFYISPINIVTPNPTITPTPTPTSTPIPSTTPTPTVTPTPTPIPASSILNGGFDEGFNHWNIPVASATITNDAHSINGNYTVLYNGGQIAQDITLDGSNTLQFSMNCQVGSLNSGWLQVYLVDNDNNYIKIFDSSISYWDTQYAFTNNLTGNYQLRFVESMGSGYVAIDNIALLDYTNIPPSSNYNNIKIAMLNGNRYIFVNTGWASTGTASTIKAYSADSNWNPVTLLATTSSTYADFYVNTSACFATKILLSGITAENGPAFYGYFDTNTNTFNLQSVSQCKYITQLYYISTLNKFVITELGGSYDNDIITATPDTLFTPSSWSYSSPIDSSIQSEHMFAYNAGDGYGYIIKFGTHTHVDQINMNTYTWNTIFNSAAYTSSGSLRSYIVAGNDGNSIYFSDTDAPSDWSATNTGYWRYYKYSNGILTLIGSEPIVWTNNMPIDEQHGMVYSLPDNQLLVASISDQVDGTYYLFDSNGNLLNTYPNIPYHCSDGVYIMDNHQVIIGGEDSGPYAEISKFQITTSSTIYVTGSHIYDYNTNQPISGYTVSLVQGSTVLDTETSASDGTLTFIVPSYAIMDEWANITASPNDGYEGLTVLNDFKVYLATAEGTNIWGTDVYVPKIPASNLYYEMTGYFYDLANPSLHIPAPLTNNGNPDLYGMEYITYTNGTYDIKIPQSVVSTSEQCYFSATYSGFDVLNFMFTVPDDFNAYGNYIVQNWGLNETGTSFVRHINGQLYNYNTEAPIINGHVEIRNINTNVIVMAVSSNDTGYYNLDFANDFPMGIYSITAYADGYGASSVSFTSPDVWNGANSYTINFPLLLISNITPIPTTNSTNPYLNGSSNTFFSDSYWNMTPGTIGIIIAAIIIIICVGICGFVTKGSGIGLYVGAMVGFIISTALNLLSQNTVILFVIFAILGAVVIVFLPKHEG